MNAKQEAFEAGEALGKEHALAADGPTMSYSDPDVREQFLRGYRRHGRMHYEAPVHEPTPPGWRGGGHYSINWIRPEHSWEWIRSKFKHGPTESCWVIFSTSGVHGTYGTIDGMDECRAERLLEGDYDPPALTFLCVEARLVRVTYGNVVVRTKENEDWLRSICEGSLERIHTSQDGNTCD